MLGQQTKKLLPKKANWMLEVLQELHNAPDEMSLPCVLATMSFAAQGLYDVNPKYAERCPLSMNFMVLADTGAGKTTVMNEVIKPINKFIRLRHNDYTRQMEKYEVSMLRWESQKKQAAKSKEEDRDVTTPTKPTKPVGITYLIKKATTNGIIVALEDVPFTGLFSSDAGEFFNSHCFTKDATGTEALQMFADLFSGGDLQRQTGETQTLLKNKRLTMLTMIQQQLAGFLRDPKYTDGGFLPRLLITQPADYSLPDADYSKEGEERITVLRSAMEPFHERILELLLETSQTSSNRAGLRKPLGMYENDKNDGPLPIIEFSDEALPIMQYYRNTVVKGHLTNPEYKIHRPFVTRMNELACRLAGVLAVFEGQEEISERFATCACEIVDWFFECRKNLNVDVGGEISRHVTACEELVRWMKKEIKQDKNVEFSKQYMTAYAPNWFRRLTSDDRYRVLREAIDRGLVKEDVVKKNATKTKTVFVLVDGQG